MPHPPLLLEGDCLRWLAEMPDNSVDAIVTDPPYGLAATDPAHVAEAITRWVGGERDYLPSGRGFMGKEWDSFVPPPAVWDECLRILKPGGHLLAFAGSRTQDLMGLSIRLAGFDIRDSIAWLYGSGFPKSMDVSKAIDKLDAVEERAQRARTFQAWLSAHMTPKRVNELTGTDMGHHLTTHPTQPAVATAGLFNLLRPELPEVPAEIEALVAQRTVESQNFKSREVTGVRSLVDTSQSRLGFAGETYGGTGAVREVADTVAHTDAAREWEGWGTALKPAHEPIIVARKPFPGTVAANVLAHGTGALNIDATRIGTESTRRTRTDNDFGIVNDDGWKPTPGTNGSDAGRWPANVVLDESQAAALDVQSGTSRSIKGKPRASAKPGEGYGMTATGAEYDDTGGASRFFYVAKAPRSERPVVDGTAHPTVKPVALMRWLVRLVTPVGGCVVDPFAGSGTTLEAAYLEGFESIGIELTPDYWPLIEARIARVTAAPKRGH